MSQTDTPPNELASRYTPIDVEGDVSAKWAAANAFHAEPNTGSDDRKPYSIVIPPPNVTAALHMGHALNNTLQDMLIRYHRMLGDNAMWMPGTDHAGIATQTVVDKRLKEAGEPALLEYKEKERNGEGGRDQFIEKVQAWKDEYEERITNQLKDMGCSCDWDRQRFTMDDTCAKAVREAFFKLFKDGLIYRGKRLVNWDPVSQTALADDEVENQIVDGHFWYMKYPVVRRRDEGTEGSRDQGADDSELDGSIPRSLDGSDFIDTGDFVTVATTRPETMLGDTAVAVNPGDPERAKYIGQNVRLPIVNRIIPVVGDDYVVKPDANSSDEKAKYASGFLKVTPAHDQNDWAIGLRHDLPVINVMAPDGSISKDHGWDDWDATPRDEFAETVLGMDRYDARKAIVDWFKERDLLADVKPYTHSVGHSYRSHVPVEPYLSDQWYVKVTDDRLAGAALRALAEDQRSPSDGPVWKEEGSFDGGSNPAAENGVRFSPSRYAKTFQTWHENIRDWCISRQLWWGHRIPVWTIEYAHDLGSSRELKLQIVRDFLGNHLDAGDFDVTNDGPENSILICTRNETADDFFDGLARMLNADDDRSTTLDASIDPGMQFAEDIHQIVRDPDVLDTWFSSGLWPISTLGWPEEENNAALQTWNPSNVLCTAREIITLWVSRMVMFNVYFRGCLPFTDVFIHAMIQDGHGQKMSKSLGNGVDPLDIIHSHGSDAMRFTLAAMTTQTQDVRMPVDMVCPHTEEAFTPKFVKTKAGHMVASPTQKCPTDGKKKITSSYGVASGKATPTDDAPLARNTSEKFDFGRNFANKIWNAVRFALGNIVEGRDQGTEGSRDQGNGTDSAFSGRSQIAASLADRWILSRLTRTIQQTDKALNNYEFKPYADGLYDFIWRDFCDWYIEAIKPTIQSDANQQRVLVTVIDAFLRLLHPSMPFMTEKLFEHLNTIAPDRGLPDVDGGAGFKLPSSELLIQAPWPKACDALIDEGAEAEFEQLQQLVAAAREVRTSYKVPPRQKVDASIKVPAARMEAITACAPMLGTLANLNVQAIATDTVKPEDAAAALLSDVEIYLHGLIDADAELERLQKAKAELIKSRGAMQGRLSNESYISKAPEKLVQETRDKLADVEKELATIEAELRKYGSA